MRKTLSLIAACGIVNSVNAADLTVYTYDSFVSEWGPGPQLEATFEAHCQCDIEFIAVDDGISILNRVRIEQDKTKADILLGLDDSLTEITRKEGLIQPHGIKLDTLKTDLNWHDPNFIPYDYGFFSFVYNSDKVSEPAVSLKELIDSDASVIYQDPRTSTPGQGLMLWVKAVYGNQAPAAWKQLATHTVTVTKGWWEAYSMFLEGDADYVLSYNTSPAYHVIIQDKPQYKAALFNEGHIAQIEVAAISKYSKNPDLAKQFLQFLISPEAQSVIPTTNWMLPVINNIELPAVFDTLIAPKRIGFTPKEIAKKRKKWLREWRSTAN
ncbi:thiamine ABC transporter substrate binding subunit [Neptunomonas antarctica]|uniref:Thiamine-binding periplasmic protein n=1 Tax=Neptunomonas antarctica TaxID=619304 RepID=A0A1N7P4L3_9GAMM|nr:thiamine ABC transporter substrate binding subunit [Neptunomonas antarctica]SIT05521.1 thiamine transport system substrate-binding protein [Neptunomonas antarctica]